MIHIRKSTEADIDSIMLCYDIARKYMRSQGNMLQWINGYPSRQLVEQDIERGVGYVGMDDGGEIVMAFALIIGEDPTYSVIEDGDWPDDRPYGTIHRLASAGRCGGVLRTCVDFCFSQIDTLRLDTHAHNSKMQEAAARLGFKRCGIIYCDDGSPRVAYQKNITRD